MGEELDQRFNKISSSSSRVEDKEELGESSDEDSSSDEASASPPNPSTTCHVPPASQLPIKRRGLSKFYQGKSESFSSFSDVRSVEDLAKKATPVLKREMKPSKSYVNGLLHIETNNNSSCDQNKVPRVASWASSVARTASLRNCKPHCIPLYK